jgi:hypothetical protein
MSLWTSHLRPFRDYNEKDVINLFTLTGVSLPQGNGVLVTITGGGFIPNLLDRTELLGDYAQGPGQAAFLNNVQAQRYGSLPKVTLCQSGSYPLGITLFDMAEYDENGEPLKYNPRKAAEIEAVISGQSVPIVTKGIFQISGLDANLNGAPVAGAPGYVGANGLITTQAITTTYDQGTGAPFVTPAANVKVGIFLGQTGTDGSFFFRLSL